jgi:hypothetical protein
MLPLLLPLLLTGCKGVEPAPADLDGLAHWFWTVYDAPAEGELEEGLDNLYAAGGADSLAVGDEADGTLTDLTDDDLVSLGLSARDLSLAQGVYLSRLIACDMDTLEPLLYAADQATLYPGIYDSYTREFTTDLDSFIAGEDVRVDWTVDYAATVLSTSYSARTNGGLQRVEGATQGPALLQRTYMPDPASYEADSGKSMDQDYQFEAYLPRADGQVWHFYALWRQAEFGGGLTSDDEGVQRILLNSLSDWDDTTQELCAQGGV